MKSALEVTDAVKDGGEATELELICSIIAYHSLRMSMYFDLARFCVEIDTAEGLTPKTIRGLKRAWENQEWLSRDLEKFILDSSQSPLLSKEEKLERFSKNVSMTAMRLKEVLSSGKP
jgi:hypothetical protein